MSMASFKELFSAVISVSSIAVGFLATSKSIMLSLDKRRVIRQLKDIGVYGTLLSYLMTAVNWSFATAIFTALALFVDTSRKVPDWYPNAFAVWIFVTITAALSCYRVIRIFYKILRASN
jgi:hypothetical protein